MISAQQSAWYPTLISTSFADRSWLQFRGSLTRRIQSQCESFRVQPVFQSLATVHSDERVVMNIRHGELAMVREVYLYCGNKPVVFAHSVVARKDLRGAWRGLSGLGNKSLGTVLFTNPKIKRTPLEFSQLSTGHILYDRACHKLQKLPSYLWARRSLFTLHGQSILVTEVFLPAILDLKT
ncbi:MAG: chorismate lyase [Nitrosomonas sp.]|nr:chorismate lyase [Nitrosomonas sp.]MDP1949570.1 chorismate lyase [Nitrosomonas sp.]